MSDWQPRQFDPVADGAEGVQRLSRQGVDCAVCPSCGAHRIPEDLAYVEGVPSEISGGVRWACGACVSGWVSTGRIGRAALARALGAPQEHAAALELADMPDLPTLEANLLAEIDRQAEAQRARYITLGDGQAMTYEQKRLEMARFDAGEPGPFPFLDAEAAARGVDVGVVAGEVRAATEEWRVAGARIEARRMAAKAAVRAAATVEDKQAAANVDWSE